MKKIVIVFLFLFSAIQVYSQEQNQLEEIMNITLEKYLEIKKSPINDYETPRDLSEVYLNVGDDMVNFEISQKVKDTGIRLINFDDKFDVKLFKNPRLIIGVSFPVLQGNAIRIDIGDWSGFKKGKRLWCSTPVHGATFLCQYSCETGKWEMVSMDYK